MQLSKDTLIDLAGWQPVKQARTLVAAGSVLDADLTEPEGQPVLIKGTVQEGRKKFRCGLVVRSSTDADNLCSCPASRRDGRICAHSIAVALAVIDTPARSKPADSNPAQDQAKVDKSAPSLDISEIPTRLPLTVSRHPEFAERALLVRPPLPDHEFLPKGKVLLVLNPATQLAIPTNLAETPLGFRSRIAPLLTDAKVESRLDTDHNWLRLNADYIHCMFHVECSDGLIESLRILPGIPEISLSVEGSLNRIDLELTFDYPENTAQNPVVEQAAKQRLTHAEFASPRARQRPVASSPDALPKLKRSAARQSEASESESRDLKPSFRVSASIRGENNILDFYAGPLDQIIAESEWNVSIGERFAHLTADIEKVRPRIETESSGTDWLSFNLRFTSTDERDAISESEIRRLLDTGQSRTKLPSGRPAAIDRSAVAELYQTLEDISPNQSQDAHGRRKVKSSQKFYAEQAIADYTQNPEYLKTLPVPAAPGLEANLRPYQTHGLAWLFRRMSAGHGAILADEMGLGKTVQTLALIASLPRQGDPVLIVAPTSLIPTWQREVQKFLPRASFIVLHGPNRARRFKEIGTAEIVVTSYGALVRDVERYPLVEFALAVVDEASFLRNPKTKTAIAASQIHARSRLALTGTPVENSIQDIWAIMQFAVPGYLGRRDDFIARFNTRSSESARHLHKRLAPFLLRRTKSQVATDLPEKIERILYCELSLSQRKVYDSLIREGRNTINNLISNNGLGSSRMEVLTLLLRLRQACCDLRLLQPGSDLNRGSNAPHKASSKLAALDDLLSEALPAGHRILIFSQFVSMLALVREQLDGAGHRYAYLDGSTPASTRAKEVERFQNQNTEIPIFLISLKAGGYGLTLTAADTVIHLDPWWNPAVEAQATDRAHRIGQFNPVTAYKFITTGTVEEKILELQNRKRHLIATALDDRRPLMTSLTREDIEFVFS